MFFFSDNLTINHMVILVFLESLQNSALDRINNEVVMKISNKNNNMTLPLLPPSQKKDSETNIFHYMVRRSNIIVLGTLILCSI